VCDGKRERCFAVETVHFGERNVVMATHSPVRALKMCLIITHTGLSMLPSINLDVASILTAAGSSN
jgi:hypothetical protein